jgi:single-stranded DNA-binding protein
VLEFDVDLGDGDEANVYLVGVRAERLAPLIDEGDAVGIVGRLRTDKWTGSDGRKRSRMRVQAAQVTLPGRSGEIPF